MKMIDEVSINEIQMKTKKEWNEEMLKKYYI